MKKAIFFGVLFLIEALFSTSVLATDSNIASLGTGGATGVYYPIGRTICRLINKNQQKTGIRCSVNVTDGSVFNINAIRSSDLDIGIVQSDIQHQAYKGIAQFKKKGAFKNLRSLFSLYIESSTLIVRSDSNIEKFSDLKGKRVNIGRSGSGSAGTYAVIEKIFDMNRNDLKLATELTSSAMGYALCDNKIDAYFILIGHPAGLIKETAENCDIQIINIDGSEVDGLIKNNSFYSYFSIPEDMYGNPKALSTFGVRATFVTSAKASNAVVYEFVKTIFEDFEKFKGLHSVLKNIKKSEMVKNSLFAPLHRGAEKYYKEIGLIK